MFIAVDYSKGEYAILADHRLLDRQQSLGFYIATVLAGACCYAVSILEVLPKTIFMANSGNLVADINGIAIPAAIGRIAILLTSGLCNRRNKLVAQRLGCHSGIHHITILASIGRVAAYLAGGFGNSSDQLMAGFDLSGIQHLTVFTMALFAAAANAGRRCYSFPFGPVVVCCGDAFAKPDNFATNTAVNHITFFLAGRLCL